MKRNERRARLEVSAESGRVGTTLCARAYSPKCLERRQRVEKVGVELIATTNRALKAPKTAYLVPNLG